MTVVGMFYTDHASIARASNAQPYWFSNTSKAALRYMPVLDLIRLNANEEITFCTGDTTENIETYNRHNRFTSISPEIVNSTKVDVSMNHLIAGDIDIVLNCTNVNLTITADNGIPCLHRPITNAKLKQDLDGSIVIISITMLNSINAINEIYGVNNYIQTLEERFAGKHDIKSVELHAMYRFIHKCVTDKEVNNRILSDTMKLVTCRRLTPESIAPVINGGVVGYCAAKRMQFETCSVLEAKPHPELTKEYLDHKNIAHSLRANGISCFIVDPDDKLGDRYHNFAGKVYKIPKIKDKDKGEGLYYLSVDTDKKVQLDDIVALDKIDECGYVYKSIEEAQIGADSKTQYRDNLETSRLTVSKEALELKQQLQRELKELDAESARRRVEHEQEMNKLRASEAAMRAANERERGEIKLEAERIKQEGDKFKFQYDMNRYHADTNSLGFKQQYEQGRYERDSTIETIKTIGAVAGFAAAGFVMFSKLSKN